MADVGEIERRRLADRRAFALDLGRANVGRGLLGRPLGLLVGRALAGLETDGHRRAGQPLLHRRLDLGRADPGILVERAFVEVGLAGINLAFGKGHRLAAEAADLLEALLGLGISLREVGSSETAVEEAVEATLPAETKRTLDA